MLCLGAGFQENDKQTALDSWNECSLFSPLISDPILSTPHGAFCPVYSLNPNPNPNSLSGARLNLPNSNFCSDMAIVLTGCSVKNFHSNQPRCQARSCTWWFFVIDIPCVHQKNSYRTLVLHTFFLRFPVCLLTLAFLDLV